MATMESAKKVCIVCGADVAGKPRVKDAAGRYMCAGVCEKQAAAAAKAEQAHQARAARQAAPSPAPTAPPMSDGGSLLNKLIDDSPMMKAATCEGCGSPMVGGAVLCTRCGFNTQTGKNLRTAVQKLPKEDSKATKAAAEAGATAVAWIRSPLIGGAALFLLLTGVGIAGATMPEFLLLSFFVMFICYMVSAIWAVVDAFRNDEPTFGGIMLFHVLALFSPFGGLSFGLLFGLLALAAFVVGFFAIMWYVIAVTERGWLKAIYLGTAAAGIAWTITVRATDGEVFHKLLEQISVSGGGGR